MPDYTKAIRKVKQENPDVADVSIEPSGFLSKFLSSGANASASPWTGNITYNPNMMNRMSPDEAENIFTHELTHSRQIKNTPYLQRFLNVGKSLLPGFAGGEEEYYQRPRELEAFQAEKDRTARMNLRNIPDPMTGRKDIELYKMPDISKRQAMFNRLRGVRNAGG